MTPSTSGSPPGLIDRPQDRVELLVRLHDDSSEVRIAAIFGSLRGAARGAEENIG